MALALTEFNLKLRAFAMLIFRHCGFGHLEEDFVIQVVMVSAITPFFLLVIILAYERHMIAKRKRETLDG